MLFAAVDIGSNTLRLLLANIEDGSLKPIKYDRVITRLARGLGETGSLNEKACSDSILALEEFAETLRDSNVTDMRCVGTSALREAKNSAEFITRVKEASGLEIEVISGEEEAELTAKGVLSSFGEKGPYVIVDIGGGSTEIIYPDSDGRAVHLTEPTGVVKLLEAHIKSDPPKERELSALMQEAQTMWKGLNSYVKSLAKLGAMLLGTAGTASTLAAIDLGLEKYDSGLVHGHSLSLENLCQMFDQLKCLPLSDRALIKGLEPERADLIIPGIILTISLMESLGYSDIRVSERGLLEGIIFEMAGEVLKSEL